VALARAFRIVKSVLFVCTGNICRSPIAEGLFRRLLGNRKDIEVVSAGVHAVRGQPPSLYAVQVCEDEGVDISGQRSQPISSALVDRATHIFAMTGGHVETIQTMFPQSADKTFLLREFEEPGTTVWRDVPDPIGLGRDVYVGGDIFHRMEQERLTPSSRIYGEALRRTDTEIYDAIMAEEKRQREN